MNVVAREKRINPKGHTKYKNEFVRKDASLGKDIFSCLLFFYSIPPFTNIHFIRIGIRGASVLPLNPFSGPKNIATLNNAPRYQFNKDETGTSTIKMSSMGPPPGPPRSAKRK